MGFEDNRTDNIWKGWTRTLNQKVVLYPVHSVFVLFCSPIKSDLLLLLVSLRSLVIIFTVSLFLPRSREVISLTHRIGKLSCQFTFTKFMNWCVGPSHFIETKYCWFSHDAVIFWNRKKKPYLSFWRPKLIRNENRPLRTWRFKKNLVLPGTSLYNLEHAFCVAMH